MGESAEQSSKLRTILVAVLGLALVAILLYFGAGRSVFKTPEEERAWRASEEQKIAALIRVGDIKTCDTVEYKDSAGTDYSTVCRNNIALAKALETLDVSWCKNLDNTLVKIAECERRTLLASLTHTPSLSVCANASTDSARNACEFEYWFKDAVSNSGVASCEKLSDTILQSRCRESWHVRELVHNPKAVSCAIFSSGGLKDDCRVFKEAVGIKQVQKRVTQCPLIVDGRIRSACETLSL